VGFGYQGVALGRGAPQPPAQVDWIDSLEGVLVRVMDSRRADEGT
jgi:hypothetical protein